MTPAARAAYREIYRQAVAGEPIIRADYNVYRQGRRLTFVKENCPPDSRDAWFSVNFFPPDPEPLGPAGRGRPPSSLSPPPEQSPGAVGRALPGGYSAAGGRPGATSSWPSGSGGRAGRG